MPSAATRANHSASLPIWNRRTWLGLKPDGNSKRCPFPCTGSTRRASNTSAQSGTRRTAAPQLAERVGLYRRLRLPSLPDRQAEILRRLDIEGMLGTDLMVVGTNAFAAYELACGARFPPYQAVNDLPQELRSHFDAWAGARGYVPA